MLFLILVWLISYAQADDGQVDPQVATLCSVGGVEGRYHGTLEGHGDLTVYLVCTGLDRIEATWIMGHQSYDAIALPHVAIDGDQLTFTSFSLVYDDASQLGASHSPGIRFEASLAALRGGRLSGEYKTSLSRLPMHVEATREQQFPNLVSIPSDGPTPHGTFQLNRPLADSGLKPPIFIDLDLVNGIDRVTFVDSGATHYSLFMGMVANGHGNLIYASSGVDDGAGAVLPLIHIRGRMTAPDTFEFYYFNTLYGMSGPYRAERYKHLSAEVTISVAPRKKIHPKKDRRRVNLRAPSA